MTQYAYAPLTLTDEQWRTLAQRILDEAVYYGETMDERRINLYIDRLLSSPKLTSFERIMKAFDMASWQMRTFPMVADLSNMFHG